MFIGARSTILPGIVLGPDVIVAAGSVVTKNFNGGVVIGGNPAHVIGSIQDLIEKRARETEIKPVGMTKQEEVNWAWGRWREKYKNDKCP